MILSTLDLDNISMPALDNIIQNLKSGNPKAVKKLIISNGHMDMKLFVKNFSECTLKKYVKSISFTGANLTDEDIKILSEIFSEGNEIKSLDLSSNKIGDVGAKALAEALTKSKIVMLNLNKNQITDQGLLALSYIAEEPTITFRCADNNISKQLTDSLISPKPGKLNTSLNKVESPVKESKVTQLPPKQLSELYNILNNVSAQFNQAAEKCDRAFIILGEKGSGKTTLANLFAEGMLIPEEDRHGNVIIPRKSLDAVNKSLPVNISYTDKGIILVESNYLSEPKTTKSSQQNLINNLVNNFFIQKALSAYSLKFVITINHDDFNINSDKFLLTVKNLSAFFQDIAITQGNIVLVVTSSTINKTPQHINNYIQDILAAAEENKHILLTEKDKKIIEYLKNSICMFAKPITIEEIKSDNILAFIDKTDQYLPSHINNKVTIDDNYLNIADHLLADIKTKLTAAIKEISTIVTTKWETLPTELFQTNSLELEKNPTVDQLQTLKNIFAKLRYFCANDIESFLKLNDILYEFTKDIELKNKVEIFSGYLKYYTQIRLLHTGVETQKLNYSSEKEILTPLITTLNNKITLIIKDFDIELLAAFKESLCSGNSFNDQLYLAIKQFCDSGKNIRTLTLDDFNYFDKLIKLTTQCQVKNIANIADLHSLLKDIIQILPNNHNLSETLHCKIGKLEWFIKDTGGDSKILTEIWNDFARKDILQEITPAIRNSFEDTNLDPKGNITYYKKVIESLAKYNHIVCIEDKIASAHCYIGDKHRDNYNYGKAINSYEQALKVNSSNKTPYQKIANIYLLLKNYKEAVDYFIKSENYQDALSASDAGIQHIKYERGNIGNLKWFYSIQKELITLITSENYLDALEVIEKKIAEIRCGKRDEKDLAWFYEAQGDCYRSSNSLELTRLAYKQAERLYSKNSDHDGSARVGNYLNGHSKLNTNLLELELHEAYSPQIIGDGENFYGSLDLI